MLRKPLYLAGDLFHAASRTHLLNLAVQLEQLGYEVVLPQKEAMKFQDPTTFSFNIRSIVKDCWAAARNPDNLFVGCVDGADADSGTCVEYGMAMESTGRAVVYRTDFRTSLEKEVGLNAMLTAEGTEFVYHPCFVTDLGDVVNYYRSLAEKIDEVVQRVLAQK